ncbi:hypothetical protein [Nonomuraea sp. NPDC005650]|uniref:hypothetical protein n=1 Tax=Nonomuraea sp. NPDC005650 TaxID=3157045 RepID=UPI0033A34449
MPRRTDGPPPRGPQSEPFETTGAFALPKDPVGGFPPANDTARGFPQPGPGEAGPFETTGAFARPPEWGPAGDRPFDADRPGPFDGPADRPFDGPADRTAVFGGPGPSDGFGGPGNPGPPPGRGPFDTPGPAERTAFFGGPDGPPGPGGPGRGPFETPGPFDGPMERTAFFDGPDVPGGAFGGPPADNGPFDGTGRPPMPPMPPSVPPEPGDIKVAGEPTAVHAPAWANAETGFLASDWAADSGIDEPDEPKGRRGRRKGGRGGGGGGDDMLAPAPSGAGKGRVALLSVAAVAVVLGGTVAGVKFMSSGEPAKCSGATCAAVQASTNRPGPEASQPTEEESTPEEEPSEEESADEPTTSQTPSPTASYSARTPRRTASATPTPSKTKVKTSAKPTKDPTPPVEELASETPTAEEEPSTLDDSDTGGAPTSGGSTPLPTGTGTFGSGQGGAMNIKQTIKQRLLSYQADMTLSNASRETLENPTVSVPVEGEVMTVTGAQWTQDGDLLILDLSASLTAGDSVNVTFTATGKGEKAANCGLVSGDCAVS